MSSFRFACPNCGHGYEVPARYVGRVGKCSSCRKRIQVPEPKAARAPREEIKRHSTQRLPPVRETRDLSASQRAKRVHALVRLGNESFPLQENLRRLQVGKTLVIGRSHSCDIAVRSAQVSRRHALLTWVEHTPWIEDLGSHNGTLVNGEPVQEHALRDGDELAIGPFGVTYLCRPPQELEEALDVMACSRIQTQFTRMDAMSGWLEVVSVLEVLQTLEFNGKTGTLEIQARDGRRGRIGVQAGHAVFGELGTLCGEEAIQGLLQCEEGRFAFKAELSDEPTFRKPITSLLLDAQRRRDEAGG